MVDMQLDTRIFAGAKEKIEILGSANRTTNSMEAGGIGYSAARPVVAKRPAKYSGAARFLDILLIDKKINMLEGTDQIYMEINHSGKTYHALCKANEIMWADKAPAHLGFYSVMPYVAFALSANSTNTELKDVYKKIEKTYSSHGVANSVDVLLFCDSFYYGFVKNHSTVKVYENEPIVETVKQAYKSGQLAPIELFKDVIGLPPLDAVGSTSINPSEVKERRQKEVDYDAIKSGDFIIPYSWNSDQYDKIPSIESLNEFVPNKTYYSVLRKIGLRTSKVLTRVDAGLTGVDAIGKDYINLTVVGKPGTGKTTVAYALGASAGIPTYSVAISKNTEEDEFQGKTKVIGGGLNFVTTDFLDAYTNGGIIVLEEVNLADPAVIMGALGQAIEFPFILKKDGFETVRRHPLCIIVNTMNIGTYGAKGVSQAYSSRNKQTYTLDDPMKDDFISILMKHCSKKKVCEWVYTAYTKIIDYLKSPRVNAEDLCLNVTLRGCIGALENMEEGEDPKEAISNTLVGKIAEVDLKIAQDVRLLVVEKLTDLKY